MSNLITIKNESLSATVSTLGAELQSLTDRAGNEYIWQGDPAVWSGRSPVLFPICGGLKENKYTLDGKFYELSKHGFAKRSEFIPVSVGESEAIFLLRENEQTLVSYPFSFEFYVSFALVRNSLQVEYKVVNLSDRSMYFSCGAHEGFALPCGIDGTKIVFEKAEQLKNYKVTHGLLDTVYDFIGDGSDTITLSKENFAVDAIVLPEISSRSLTLVSADCSRKIKVDFPDFDHLLVWQMAGADYVCIEPWSGLPDIYGKQSYAIEEKESITSLKAKATLSYKHTVTVI